LKAVTYAFPPGYRENAEEEEDLSNLSKFARRHERVNGTVVLVVRSLPVREVPGSSSLRDKNFQDHDCESDPIILGW
jgi:hypothetical protein